MQRRAHAEHHSADGLRPRRLGVQDTAGGEYAEHAPQTHLTGIRVDADLGEMCAVGLLREILVVAARPDFAVGVHPSADKVCQLSGLFSGCDAAVGEACGRWIHAGGPCQLFTQRVAGLEQGRARTAGAP